MTACVPGSLEPCSTEPFPLSVVNPSFSEEAKRLLGAGAILVVNFVVGKDGLATDIKVAKSVGGGADDAAISAISGAKFEPGTYLGRPVAVRMSFSFGPRPTPVASEEQLRTMWTEATQAFANHDFYTAGTLARRAIELSPFSKNWRFLLGASLAGLDRLPEAANAFRAEIKLDPASQTAYRALGRTYAEQRRSNEAIAQFKKAIEINSQDRDAYMLLGTTLFSERDFTGSLPMFEEALALAPNNAKALLMKGMTEVSLGRTAQGIADLEKGLNTAPEPGSFYRAAYVLADNNVELDRATTWAQTATTIESARLQSISIANLSPAQFGLVSEMAKCWHTIGWIHFRRGEFDQARIFLEAAWYVRPSPPIGNHLGQTYESLHRINDAERVYAMAIAADEIPRRELMPPGTVEEVTERLKRLMGKNTSDLSQYGKNALEAMRMLTVPNQSRWQGSADLVVTLESKNVLQARQLSSDTNSHDFTKLLLGLRLPVELPIEGQLQIPRRGTLTCPKDTNECRLRFLWDEEAFRLATKEASGADTTMPTADLP